MTPCTKFTLVMNNTLPVNIKEQTATFMRKNVYFVMFSKSTQHLEPPLYDWMCKTAIGEVNEHQNKILAAGQLLGTALRCIFFIFIFKGWSVSVHQGLTMLSHS